MQVPSTFDGVSLRFCDLPSSLNCDAGLSSTSFGGVSLEAASASAPNFSFLPCGEMMTPFSALQLRASTPHSAAAALASMCRAVAPALRSFSQPSRTLVLPPVIWPPIRLLMYASPGGANSVLMRVSSTPSSSAMSIGSEVYTPWPISARSHRKVMLLSVPMRSQALVSMTFRSPLDFGDCLQAGKLMAMTRPPTKLRRDKDNDDDRFADMLASSPETRSRNRSSSTIRRGRL